MTSRGESIRQEILCQRRVWQTAFDLVTSRSSDLDIFPTDNPDLQIIFSGCGSGYYLSLVAAEHLRELTGWRTEALPASELWFAPELHAKQEDVLIAISRSGATTETLFAVDAFRAVTQGKLITLRCHPDSPLGQRGDINLLIPATEEKSIPQTGSFSGVLLAIMTVNALWAKRDDLVCALGRLPEPGERVLESAQEFGREWGSRLEFDRIYFLGTGMLYGLACESSLKMKEMSLSHAEPFHFLEFRHGPKAMVTDTTLVVGLVSERTQAEEMRVLREVNELGAHVITLGEKVETVGSGGSLSFESGLPEQARGVLYLPPVQMLAFERAMAKGLDPDHPRHLDSVVVL